MKSFLRILNIILVGLFGLNLNAGCLTAINQSYRAGKMHAPQKKTVVAVERMDITEPIDSHEVVNIQVEDPTIVHTSEVQKNSLFNKVAYFFKSKKGAMVLGALGAITAFLFLTKKFLGTKSDSEEHRPTISGPINFRHVSGARFPDGDTISSPEASEREEEDWEATGSSDEAQLSDHETPSVPSSDLGLLTGVDPLWEAVQQMPQSNNGQSHFGLHQDGQELIAKAAPLSDIEKTMVGIGASALIQIPGGVSRLSESTMAPVYSAPHSGGLPIMGLVAASNLTKPGTNGSDRKSQSYGGARAQQFPVYINAASMVNRLSRDNFNIPPSPSARMRRRAGSMPLNTHSPENHNNASWLRRVLPEFLRKLPK